jgi:cation diffusion facilitator family transporter
VDDDKQSSSSTRTVIVAESANLAIAVAKIVAAVLTGSASMWAEAAHSVADSGNEVLLFIGLRRSSKGPDERHPFGYGQERYFWAFLAALGIFLIGGALSIGEGIRSLLLPEPLESLWVGIGVLVVSAAMEGYSWHTARKQLRADAQQRRRTVPEQLSRSSDPSATTVFLEDSAALIGLSMALVALVLHAVTGWAAWDAVGSVGIGILLIIVAFLLARRSKALLLDESAPADVLEPIRSQVAQADWIAEVRDLQAVYVGPGSLLVNLWLRPERADKLVEHIGELRSALLENPAIAQVTITPVTITAEARRSVGGGADQSVPAQQQHVGRGDERHSAA